MDFTGKNVLYVGAFGGIGIATCKYLIEKKNIKSLYVLNRSKNDELLSTFKSINPKVAVYYIQYDLKSDLATMKQKFREIIANIKTIDVLFHGSGICNDQLIEETIQVNLTGVINTTVAALEHMDKRKGGNGGVIVSISSIAGLLAIPMIPVYCATKAALNHFTTSLSLLQPQNGITTCSICPGATETPIMGKVQTFVGFSDDPNSLKNLNTPKQSAEINAELTIKAIEQNKNGAVWAIRFGVLKELEIKNYRDEFTDVKSLQDKLLNK